MFDLIKYSSIYCKMDCKVLMQGYNVFRDWMLENTKLDVYHYVTIESGRLSGFGFFQVNMRFCCVTSSFGTVLSLARDECAAHGAARPRQHAGLVLYI